MFDLVQIGSAVSNKNCLGCTHYLGCKDPHKSVLYRCERFKKTKVSESDGDLRLFDALELNFDQDARLVAEDRSKKIITDLHSSSFDIRRTIQDVIKNDLPVSPDIKIDDSDHPQAPNFFTFCIGDKFLKQKPFLEQAIIATIVFADYCPRCSDTEWLFHTHKVTDTLTKFQKKVALLELGICPHCHATRSELVNAGELSYYQELAVNAGQRCVVGDTLILTSDGLMRIDEYAEHKPEGFSPFYLNVNNTKELELTSDFYVSKPERVFKVRTHAGIHVTGTSDHPVDTLEGFKKLQNITKSDYLPIYFGTNTYGNKVVAVQSVLDKADLKYKERYDASTKKNQFKHTHFCARTSNAQVDRDLCEAIGLWVAEGRHTGISNHDQEVIQFYYSVLSKLVSRYHIKLITSKAKPGMYVGVRLIGSRGIHFWEELVGQNILAGSAKKVVPIIIRQGPKEYQTSFLRGLFEGDGGIEGNDVTWVSISKELADQVSAMLLNIGIAHRRYEIDTWATNGTDKQVSKKGYRVQIQGRFLEVFQKEIGFFSKRKQHSLQRILNIHKNRTKNVPFYYDKLPPPLKQELIVFVRRVCDNLSEFQIPPALHGRPFFRYKTGHFMGRQTLLGFSNQKRLGSRTSVRADGSKKPDLLDGFHRLMEDNVPLTKNKLKRFIDAVEAFKEYLTPKDKNDLEYFKRFLTPNVFYSKVTSIKLSKECHVTYDFTLPKTHSFWTNGIRSHNSGKSALIAMMYAYLIHWIIKLQNPNEVYGLLKSNMLHITFVALTYAQAKDTLWDPLYGYLIESNWFRAYHHFLDEMTARTGEELYKLNDTFVLYKHRRVFVYPSGPDKRTLRGRTRSGACFVGKTLVSTDHGLVKIKYDLCGRTTHSGNTEVKIVNHWKTGVKRAYKIKAENGLRITTTGNQDMRVLSEDRKSLVWKRADELTTDDYLVTSLGGPFPKELRFDEFLGKQYNQEDFANHRAMQYMVDNHTAFNLTDVAEHAGKTYRGVTAMMTRLRRAVCIDRTRVGSNSPMVYSINDLKVFRSLMDKPLQGKINHLRNTLTYPSKMTVELAYILGYLVSDGAYNDTNNTGTYGQEISFGTTSPEKVRHYVKCFKAVFNIEPRVSSWYKDVGKPTERKCYNVIFALQPIKDFFLYIGLKPAWARIKTVPWSILEAPRDCVAAFLSAAVSCDGSIVGPELSYLSTSRSLIEQMQLLFIRLGYACNSNINKTRYCYKLSLSVSDRNRFLVKHWTGKKKRSHHKYTISLKNDAESRYRIPDTEVFTKSSLNEGRTEYDDLVDRGLVFTKVHSVTYVGMKTVYDLTVDSEDHEFTAQGFMTKNSVDELGWFDNSSNSKKVKMNANEVYIALERSLLTVRASASRLISQGFNHVPNGYFLNISSPSSVRDKIMELVRKAQGSNHIYGVSKPTWEMNPTVPKSALAEEFRKDPVTAMRDYGAQPPLTSNAFVQSKSAVDQCMGDYRNLIQTHHVKKTSKDGTSTRYAVIDKIKRCGRPSVLALDAGISNNSFGCCVASLEDRKYPRIDLLIEIQPLPGVPLNFSRIYKYIIKPIIKARNVVLLAADRWNSAKVLSDAEEDFEETLNTRVYSVKYSDMQVFKSHFMDNQIMFPEATMPIDEILKYNQHEYPQCFSGRPVDHFVLQMLTVQDTGSQVIKGDQLTDDLARASMLATTMLLHEDYQELWMQEDEAVPESASSVVIQDMAIMKSASQISSANRPAFTSTTSGKALGLGRTRNRG